VDVQGGERHGLGSALLRVNMRYEARSDDDGGGNRAVGIQHGLSIRWRGGMILGSTLLSASH
jgi:hypothetical protein